jgi:murein DD-endopeptidase MepM/ murein hydrolase activator NlpD
MVVSGLPDNAPGVMNPYMAYGNVVMIEHADRVHSVYAHLKPGSIKVKPGDRVKRGQVIAACGNSGNTTEPHLHFQLMDGPQLESSYGVEAVFPIVDIVRNAKSQPAKSYTFLKGDKIKARD